MVYNVGDIVKVNINVFDSITNSGLEYNGNCKIVKRRKYERTNLDIDELFKEIKEMYEENDLRLPPVIENTYITGMKKEDNGNPELFLKNLDDDYDNKGALICSPDKFMEIYELEKRRMERDVPNRCIIHLRLNDQNNQRKNSEQVVDHIGKIAEQILESLVNQLRCGDIVCRWNKKHFIVLVADTEYEEAEKIVNRLKNSFISRYGLPDNISVKNKVYELC